MPLPNQPFENGYDESQGRQAQKLVLAFDP
jgi:hypothetical protein